MLLSKAILLEKVRLMVELAEAVDWLHGEKRIVHKDLAPDNLMVSFVGSDDVDWVSFVGHQDAARRGRDPGVLHEALSRAVSSPRFHLHVIDFGLSDKDQLTRSWYEEETGSGLKQPSSRPKLASSGSASACSSSSVTATSWSHRPWPEADADRHRRRPPRSEPQPRSDDHPHRGARPRRHHRLFRRDPAAEPAESALRAGLSTRGGARPLRGRSALLLHPHGAAGRGGEARRLHQLDARRRPRARRRRPRPG